MPPVLEINGLSKSFDGLRVVNDFSLALNAGELRVIIGPNGAGKTTLFNLVTGALTPDSGEVILKGERITRLPAHQRYRRGLARSFQITNVCLDLTVRQNIWLAVNSLAPRPWDPIRTPHRRGPVAERVEEAAAEVGLHDKLDLVSYSLSQADQRLLEIAIALSSRPDVVLLDEPTQGVGTKEVQELVEVVIGLAGKTTLLVIEHNMDCVMAMAHQVTVMAQGAVLAEGCCDDIVANPEVQRVYLGTNVSCDNLGSICRERP